MTVTVPSLVALAGETPSHSTSSAAVQATVPPPALVTLSVLAAGLAPPCVALDDRLLGATDSDGGDRGATVSVTGIVLGEPPAPGALTVTSRSPGSTRRPHR